MNFNNQYVSAKITMLENNKIQIKGSVKGYNKIQIIAPNPPDKLGNYSGNSLPFPSRDIAFENTKNKYIVNGEKFDIIFNYPNSYYCIVSGMNKIPPTIYFIILNHNNLKTEFQLPDTCNLKTLTNRNQIHDPSFYSSKYDVLPITTAENNMYNYSKYKRNNNKA
jgi:hypothetical protein